MFLQKYKSNNQKAPKKIFNKYPSHNIDNIKQAKTKNNVARL